MATPKHSNKAISSVSGSAFDKYRQLIIGDKSIGFLIKYELIMLFTSGVPGALGLFLRKTLYPKLLGSCGRGVVFGTNVVLRHPKKIHIGDGSVIDDNCMLDAKGETNQGIRLGKDCFVGRNSILSCKDGDITFEDGVNIGFNCEVYSGNELVIEEHVIIGAYTYLVGGEGYDMKVTGLPMAHQPLPHDGTSLRIGKGSWFGAHIVVLNKVSVGEGSVIAAGAVVIKDTEPFSINGGVPAKKLGMREGS